MNSYTLSLSIVVPVFNTGPYLDRSIRSILKQTFKDFELILVDDASTDNSLEILEKYRNNDNRVKVIHFEINKGVSAARNAGIDIAEGQFIGFIDSDDYIDEQFYEKLMQNSDDYDIVIGHYVRGTNTSKYYYQKKNIKNPGSVFDSIWRKEYLNKYNIRYKEEMRRGSDKKFRKEAYTHNPRILKVPNEGIYYYYKRRMGSIMNFSEEQLKNFNKKAYEKFIKNKKINNKKERKIKKRNKEFF